ncbi:MAG: isoleucine--tRNA ligase [SAR202 cluster bacterium]|nr:isoleucine--tRNA ligase [SAR202 cluster bacterium]
MSDAARRFQAVSSKVTFPEMEERVLRQWREDRTFQRVTEARKNAPLFVFYEGPPTANGSPGIHHVLSRSFKDVMIRYKTMRGYLPLRRGGWDTHGLPVELEVEKELGLSTKRDIEAYGIEEFNRKCRASVFRYVQDWERMTERSGVWLDMQDAYVTYDNSYIEAGWWIFKTLWDKQTAKGERFLYEGYKVTPHCPRCVTSLSSHEVALGYKDDTPDPSVYVRFPLADRQPIRGVSREVLARLGFDPHAGRWDAKPPALLVWTTTPWTLTANVAVAIAPKEEYALVASPDGAERLLLAASLAGRALDGEWEVLERFDGNELAGLAYAQPFETPDSALAADGLDRMYRVYAADYVTTEEGTGLVHTAPAYGAEDAELGRAHRLPTVHTVDIRGVLQGPFPGAGKFVKQADKDLSRDLRERGLLYREGIIRHTYPFCWRCGTPLLYYAKTSWYIRTTAMKDELVAGNQTINWYPEHIKEGRFGEWLRNNVDWAVSRERYWGTPIPIWVCATDPTHVHVAGSLDDLRGHATPETKPLLNGLDLHRPYVDRIELTCPHGDGVMKRVPEVADAWFDSGAMPFAQWNYPRTLPAPGGGTLTLRNVHELIDSAYYPADYITEAIDQTRGWFYSLLALSVLLTGKPSYKNVICLGLILDEKGEKMSKSRGNVVNPWEVMNNQGTDALRWYLFTASPAGSPRRFSGNLVAESLRRFLLTLWNTYSFFTTYANFDGFDPDAHASYWKQGMVGSPSTRDPAPNELDRWVLSELNELVRTVTAAMDGYDPTDAGRRIEEFVDLLSNWYVRRSRRRFWKSGNDADKTWAYVTLYSCLITLSKLMAPLTPFVADEIYRNLRPRDAVDSVHLSDYPAMDATLVDDRLDRAVRLAMRIASLGRAARSKSKVKVRQPLSRVLVRTRPEDLGLLPLITEQVLDELNVKTVEQAADDIVRFRIRPNLPVLGPKYGKQLGAIRKAIETADAARVATEARSGGPVRVGEFALEPDEVLLDVEETPGLSVAMEGGVLVALDTAITDDLRAEGFARELVHRVQNLRKDAGFDIADRIETYIDGVDDDTAQLIQRYIGYIRQETLSDGVIIGGAPPGAHVERQDVDGVALTLAVARASE